MIKKMEIFLKVISSFLNIIVVFVALIVSEVVLKQTPLTYAAMNLKKLAMIKEEWRLQPV